MTVWKPKLKGYPHFDNLMSVKEGEALAADPVAVARHAFYPFIRYYQRWTRFAEKGKQGEVKKRPIRYAARADAFIYSYYRHLLAEAYEQRLSERGLGDTVLAYRRLMGAKGGKCNIDFALDAVLDIRAYGTCCVVALDISKFFESLDHEKLKAAWADLLGLPELPPDHYSVFRAMTRYSVIDRELLYERLGYFGVVGMTRKGLPIKGLLQPAKAIPRKVCSNAEFRDAIVGGGGKPTLVRKNQRPYGIPQGAPISDLLANLYLLRFDEEVRARVTYLGGKYYRYSDDILLIVPIPVSDATDLETWVQSKIREFGAKLKIKPSKCALFRFEGNGGDQTFTRISGAQGRNGLEYLGFRYNGRGIYLRDSTLSAFQRKVVGSARRAAFAAVRRYPNKSAADIIALFDTERFVQRYGRVEDFEVKAHDVRKWTFWTYVTRAAAILGPLGSPIRRQMRTKRKFIEAAVEKAIVEAAR
ncbi:MAG: reverse transcriptase [Methylobacterium mesophilicum]|nr:reverse transcriptase [Methylobacterium mesophilicum]